MVVLIIIFVSAAGLWIRTAQPQYNETKPILDLLLWRCIDADRKDVDGSGNSNDIFSWCAAVQKHSVRVVDYLMHSILSPFSQMVS